MSLINSYISIFSVEEVSQTARANLRSRQNASMSVSVMLNFQRKMGIFIKDLAGSLVRQSATWSTV